MPRNPKEKVICQVCKQPKHYNEVLHAEIVRESIKELIRKVSRNLNEEFDTKTSFGDQLSDRMAEFGGSWKFIILFATVMVCWIGINTAALLTKPFDPFPYILLNLVLSCLAAVQAPVIMMSQNRQEAKDRLRAEHDYRVNLKAELEIRNLHEKVDHLLVHQWQRMMEIQDVQMDLLAELRKMDGPFTSAGQFLHGRAVLTTRGQGQPHIVTHLAVPARVSLGRPPTSCPNTATRTLAAVGPHAGCAQDPLPVPAPPLPLPGPAPRIRAVRRQTDRRRRRPAPRDGNPPGAHG